MTEKEKIDALLKKLKKREKEFAVQTDKDLKKMLEDGIKRLNAQLKELGYVPESKKPAPKPAKVTAPKPANALLAAATSKAKMKSATTKATTNAAKKKPAKKEPPAKPKAIIKSQRVKDCEKVLAEYNAGQAARTVSAKKGAKTRAKNSNFDRVLASVETAVVSAVKGRSIEKIADTPKDAQAKLFANFDKIEKGMEKFLEGFKGLSEGYSKADVDKAVAGISKLVADLKKAVQKKDA